jgi:sulfur relay (sulfurtransferase) DsrC/TusE family protein
VHFEIGDIVYHAATREQRRIVRSLAYNERIGYVAATTNWSGKVIEALWCSGEIKQTKEHVN